MRRGARGLAVFLFLAVGCDAAPSPASDRASTPEAPKGGAAPGSDPAAQPSKAAPKDDEAPAPHFMTADEIDTTVSGKGEGPYRFTSRWHTPYQKTWAEQLAEFRGKPNLRYLEVGVFEGRALLWMLENILTDASSQVTAVDVFMGDYEKTFDANIEASGQAERVTKLVGPSQTVLRGLNEQFDIIYIDGSHTADDVLADAVLSWGLLREGGVVIFDDYGWTGRPNGGVLPAELLPRLAVDAFVTSYRNYLEELHRGYQVFLRRIPNPCAVKDYCSPIGQYNYFWRELKLRRRDGEVVPLTADERRIVELIGHSKKIGQVQFSLDPRFLESAEVAALMKRLKLKL